MTDEDAPPKDDRDYRNAATQLAWAIVLAADDGYMGYTPDVVAAARKLVEAANVPPGNSEMKIILTEALRLL